MQHPKPPSSLRIATHVHAAFPAPTHLTILLWTDTPCVATLYYSYIKPVKERRQKVVRGWRVRWETIYHFPEKIQLEQYDPGELVIHTFIIWYPQYPVELWAYATYTVGGKASPSTSGILRIKVP